VVKLTSHFHFLRFLVATINQQQGRALSIVQHQGAILVTENDKLLLVHLPQAGVSMADFFGQDKGLASVGDTILIATKNEGKTKEFRKFFERFGYQVENLNNYPDLPDVAETGMTFEENARLKAETIAELTGKMVLADDSGLKVGLPGVWSARFSGPEATDERNNSKLLHELAMVFEIKDRSAQFHCTLVMAAPNRESLVVEADWDGYIGMERRGENGFGYDPLFLVGETGKTAAELSLEEKNQISHRAQALEKLVEAFPVWQEQAKQS
jgi:XTP/dITP diphosphohydrolase